MSYRDCRLGKGIDCILSKPGPIECTSLYKVNLVQSRASLADILRNKESTTNDDGDKKATTRHIVFLDYDLISSSADNTIQQVLWEMNQSGWIVFVHCRHAVFPHVLGNLQQSSRNVHAVFRRPLQLVRIGQALRNVLFLLNNQAAAAALQDGLFETKNDETTLSNNIGVVGQQQMETASRNRRAQNDWSLPSSTIQNNNGSKSMTNEFHLGTRAGVENVVGRTVHGSTIGSISNNNNNNSLVAVARPSTAAAAAASSPKRGIKRRREADMAQLDAVEPGSKVIVVDDTPINVKVLVKMLSRSTSLPIVSLFDGQSAIQLVQASNRSDLLFLMDWHMLGVCGLSATKEIRKLVKEQGGPTVYICMVTADIEGLNMEMSRRNITSEGTLTTRGQISINNNNNNGMMMDEKMPPEGQVEDEDEYAVLDVVAGKPVTFQSIQAILTWFKQQVELKKKRSSSDNLLSAGIRQKSPRHLH